MYNLDSFSSEKIRLKRSVKQVKSIEIYVKIWSMDKTLQSKDFIFFYLPMPDVMPITVSMTVLANYWKIGRIRPRS